jgi:hypothetical protein
VAYELRMSKTVGSSWCRITRAEPVVVTIADEVSPLDELFFSLDGSTVATTDEEWRVEVSGIHFGNHGRWVQLNLCGDVNYSVTLKIDTVDVRAIRDNLAACLACAAPRAGALPF